MHLPSFRGILCRIVCLSFLAVAPLASGQMEDMPDWQVRWAELESADELPEPDRLEGQVALLEAAAGESGWTDPVLWQRVLQILDALERSSSITVARDNYLALLLSIGAGLSEATEAFAGEERLREYCQRALGIVETPAEEGQLLFYLAESSLRSTPQSTETQRRVEALLQQALGLLPEEPPKDVAHLRLAALYTELAGKPAAGVPGDDSYLSRAVFHNRSVLDMESSSEATRTAARAALDALLEPGLELRLQNRFLPQSDIGVTVATRNILEVTVEVYQLPWNPGPDALSLDALKEQFGRLESPETVQWVSKSFKVTPRDRFAWEQSTLRLGEALPGGWYWLRVSGGKLLAEDLLLVTPLELAVLPRANGFLTLWAVDAERGIPVPNAAFQVLDGAGQQVASANSGMDGLAELALPENAGWEEVHVSDGLNPGYARRADMKQPGTVAPFLIPGSIQVQPGNSLTWILSAIGAEEPATYGQSLEVQLPAGNRLPVDVVEASQDYLFCSVGIPMEATGSGPVYLILPDGSSLLLTHLEEPASTPFVLTFNGNRIETGKEVFLASKPVGLQLTRRFSRRDENPEFHRLRITRLQREIVRHSPPPASAPPSEPLFETIVRTGSTEGDSTYLDLPDLATDGEPLPLKVEILPLESEEVLGSGVLALSPYRSLVTLRVSEQIVSEGEGVAIELSLPEGWGPSRRSLAGDLAIYRETWESRYIHRKRGTLLTESEYLALPDRSLLGSAKTDYRLQERGFVREAVDRIPVGPETGQTVLVSLEKGGYYQIEFEGREQEFRAYYPDGPLEVWVLPQSGDLRAFRSEEPRLVHERDADGREEILILLDRKESAVLLDLEFVDGSLATEVLQPDSTAIYRLLEPGSPALASCHTVVTGDMESILRCQHFPSVNHVHWELEAELRSGLNPGSLVEWPIRANRGEVEDPVVWAIYPDNANEVMAGWISAQEQNHRYQMFQRDHSILMLGQVLPLYDPLNHGLQDGAHLSRLPAKAPPDPLSLFALYPELIRFNESLPRMEQMHPLPFEAGSATALLDAQLPAAAGRWQLMLFHPDSDGSVDWQSWNFSTELPIRTSIAGPDLLRLGDQLVVPLVLENTTRRQETLQIVLEARDGLSIEGRNRDVRVLEAGQRDTFPISLLAAREGSGGLLTRAEGSFSSSEALFSTHIAEEPVHPEIKAFLVMPGVTDWQESVDLDAWTGGTLLVSSGLGAALTEIWPLLRKREAVAEPLLAALGDWALERVRLHHGILKMGNTGEDTQLGEHLERFASAGGWAWTPGKEPDPWLSALVLWSLETFSGLSDDGFSGFREDAANYLESVLIDESVGQEARLFALRSLAVPAFHDPRIRPSRIQAKSFLEFLHQRDQLSNSQLASLLQVARAFRFNEEVRLLLGNIKQRFNTPAVVSAGDFWSNSLVYLALAEGANEDALRQSILNREFQHLTRTGPTRSWEQFGGFMNLLAAFLWEGDFNVEGEVLLSIEGKAPIPVSLRPDAANKGSYLQQIQDDILKQGSVLLQVDASQSAFPVAVVLMGQRHAKPSLRPYPEQTIQWYREYVETTLLSGSRQRLAEFTDSTSLYPDDALQVHVSLYVEDTENIAELEFAIPAGASLASDAIQYSFEPSVEIFGGNEPDLVNLDQPDPLIQVVRMEPLAAGRHEFILTYRINWAGTYAFPQGRLLFPRTGEIFSIGENRQLEIATPVE